MYPWPGAEGGAASDPLLPIAPSRGSTELSPSNNDNNHRVQEGVIQIIYEMLSAGGRQTFCGKGQMVMFSAVGSPLDGDEKAAVHQLASEGLGAATPGPRPQSAPCFPSFSPPPRRWLPGLLRDVFPDDTD